MVPECARIIFSTDLAAVIGPDSSLIVITLILLTINSNKLRIYIDVVD